MNRKTVLIILAVIVVLGCGLRLYQLGEKSLWTDEIVVINNAMSIVDVESFLAHTRGDDLPRLYSLLFKFWLSLGRAESTMRAFSVIFGILLIPATYALSRLFFDDRTSLCAALLTAASPFLLIYDREIRMYSLFAFLSTLSTFFFLRSLREGKKHHWALYALANLLNIYTHYYALLVLGVQWLFVIVRFRDCKKYLKPWIAANAFLFLAFAVRLVPFIQDVMYHAPWALPRERFPFVFGKHFVDFFYIFFSMSAGQTILPWNPLAILICLSMLFCFMVAVKDRFIIRDDRLYLCMLIFIPIVIGIIVRISMPRYFVFVAPVFFILVARGIFALPLKIAATVSLVVLLGWGYGISNYYKDKQFHVMAHIDPWREIAQYLKKNIANDEAVVGIGIGVIPIRHYYGADIPGYSEVEVLDKVKALDDAGEKRIWLIYTYQEEYDYWIKSREMLKNNYRMISENKWGHDPDYELKKKLFRRQFAPYRIVVELYERKTKG